jgi:CBS domain-containing protein
MKARDIMTTELITVGPDTAIRHIAALLFMHRISAVPVVAHGKLVGIVSEADLLHRHEIGTERSRTGSRWLQLLSGDGSVSAYVRSHATRARDVMTRDVVTVTPDTPLAEVATLLERRRVKRVPVVEGEHVVGILSRSDLIKALAAKTKGISTGDTGDGAIRARLIADLDKQPWWRAAPANVTVTDGVVRYFGAVEGDPQRRAARIAAENVPGVRRVEDHRIPFAAMWSV